MNDDELKNLWQQQPLRVPDLPAAQLVPAMQNKMSAFRRTLLWRDVRELAACVVVIIIFGYFYFHRSAPMARIGDLIVIGGSIFIGWKLVRARRATPPAPPGATIVESLRAELNSVRTQSGLLGSVLWWYLLPLTIGELVCVWGPLLHLRAVDSAELLVLVPTYLFVTLVILAVNVFVYWLNQWARRKQLLPVQAQLESLLRSAETGEPLDQTDAANLRPIALSMAAAEHVKPAEFKVAFWQLALYGEIAFIGIWFFLMLGLTLSKDGWSPRNDFLKLPFQPIRAEETNRYSIVARNIIDLLNAGDSAAVQKLYDSEMAEAFPPQKASEFFADLAAHFGKIEKFDGPVGKSDEWVVFQLHCRRGELTMSLALDDDNKIGGLYFRRAANLGSPVRQIFSWQHLLWLVPFVLAGLLYSRILQKMSERAVGISTLGVHLRKGENLLLWEEIKEVRPLRVLNMRSLWLISESGKKTIMPWTSLERHSDLKAAVEGFAPLNHPLRKYLSLLKRI